MAPRTRAAAAGDKRRCLVTGGSGFVGRHLVEQLLDSGRWEVTVFDIRAVEGEDRAQYIVGDLRNAAQVAAACKGMDVVFHVATAAPTATNAHNEALMRAVNIDGTQNVVDGCVAGGVPALVYTSSASVVFDGQDLHKVDESAPYAARPMDYYTHTKVKNAKAGKMKYLIGSGRNKMDWTYAGNVAQAHIQAADALAEGGAQSAVAGKAYFVTNDDPRPFWGFMGDLCEGLGYGRPHIRLPFGLIYFIALIVQYLVVPLLRLFGKELQSDFTPFRIALSAANRTFSCSAAYQDFGYVPTVPMEEALKRTLRHFSHLHADKQKEG